MSEETTVEVIKSEQSAMVARAQAIVVQDQASFDFAVSCRREIKTVLKRATEFFAPTVDQAHKAWKTAVAMRDSVLKPLEEADKILAGRGAAWYAEQERARAEQERKLQAEADAKAARERAALEAKAAKYKTEAKQQEVLQQAAAVIAPTVAVQSQATVAKGTSFQKIPRWRIVNEDMIPKEYWTVDPKKLDAMRKANIPVPGVEYYEETIMKQRT